MKCELDYMYKLLYCYIKLHVKYLRLRGFRCLTPLFTKNAFDLFVDFQYINFHINIEQKLYEATIKQATIKSYISTKAIRSYMNTSFCCIFERQYRTQIEGLTRPWGLSYFDKWRKSCVEYPKMAPRASF